MNKRGQFYLLTTIIIVGLIFSFASVVNFSQKKTSVDISYLKDELTIESEKVMDDALYNDKNMVESLISFSETYSTYSEADNLYFIFGNRGNVTIAGYRKLSNGEILVDVGFGNQEINFIKEVYNSKNFLNPNKTINITINDFVYDFNLSSGENFYFILYKEVKNDLHIVTNVEGNYFGEEIEQEQESDPPEGLCTTDFLTISSDTNNYNIYEALSSPTNPVFVNLTINSGVVIGSTSSSSPALTTGNLPDGSIVIIINNGHIVGKGGDGANYPGGQSSGASGGNGGPALEATVPTTIENNSVISSGGGGGGSGGGSTCGECYDDPGAGGGGGAGRDIGLGGNSSRVGTYTGSPGTLTLGGAGGTVSDQGSQEYAQAGNGGAGGNLGSNGQNGEDGNGYSGGAGGSAGTTILGENFITLTTEVNETQLCTSNFNATYSNLSSKNFGSAPPGSSGNWWYYDVTLSGTNGNTGITVDNFQKCYSVVGFDPWCDPVTTDFSDTFGTNYISAGSSITAINRWVWFNPGFTYTTIGTYNGTDDNNNFVTANFSFTVIS